MKRPFALKTQNIKIKSIKDEATKLKKTEEYLEQKIKLCKSIKSKYKKLIECEEKRRKLEEELNQAKTSYKNIKANETVNYQQRFDTFSAFINNLTR